MNSDGDVVIDILLDDAKARKYWESFSSYMTMSTKQLERNIQASVKKINDLEGQYTELTNQIQKATQEKEQYAVSSQIYEEEVENIKQIEKELDELGKKREVVKNATQTINPLTGQATVSHEQLMEREREYKIIDDQVAKLEEKKLKEERILNELYEEVNAYNGQIEKIAELTRQRDNINVQLQKENQNFSDMNAKYVNMTKNAKEMENTTKNTEKHAREIKHHTASIGTNLKSGVTRLANGLKKIVRMSLALVGIRGIYTGITSVIRTWLNSQDEVAQKTKANLENLKMNFANLLQPALQWILNIFNNILAVVGAVVKQFTNLNIFAKQTAKSTKETSKNASNTLASFDKIDVLQQNTAGGDGDTNVQPTDMTELMTKYEDLAKRIKALIETLFDPFQKAWEEKGQGVLNSIETTFNKLKGLAGSIGNSLFEVWTNGTIEKSAKIILGIIENIIKSIGNVAGAWKNAWDKDNMGTKIVQNLADALNGVLSIIETITGVIEKVTAGEGYQKFANAITSGLEAISGIVKFISETFAKVFEEQSPKWAENFDKVFGNLADVIEPIVKAVKGLLGNDDFKKKFEKWVEILGNAVTILTDWLVILTDVLALIINPDWEHLEKLGSDVEDMNDDVSTLTDNLKTFTGVANAVKKVVDVLWKVISNTSPPLILIRAIKSIKENMDWEEIQRKTGEAWEKIRIFMTEKFEDAKKNVTENVNRLKKEVPEKFEELKKKVVEKFEELKNKAVEKIETLKTRVGEKFENMKSFLPNKVQEIKDKVIGKFNEIKDTAIGKIEFMKNSIVENFNTLKGKLADKVEEIKGRLVGKWEEIKNAIGGKVWEIISNIQTPFNNLGTTLKSIVEGVWNKVKIPLNNMIAGFNDLLNRLSKALNDVIWRVKQVLGNDAIKKIVGWTGLSADNIGYFDQNIWIPRLAKGGIVTQATPAIIGEAGKEAVIPLENNTEWLDMLASRLSQNQNFTIKFEGNLSQLGRILKPVIDKENNRVGRSFVVGGNT